MVGSGRRGVLGRAVLGDDACAALNGACCAVAIAPLGGGAHPRTLAKVGVGFDGSPESLAALAMARKLAATTTATIHAPEVVSLATIAYGGYLGPSFEQAVQVPLERARERLSELPDVTGRAVPGLAGEELAAFSDDVDILIVGSRGYGPVRRLVLGSTSNYLARHGRCPLLVLTRSV